MCFSTIILHTGTIHPVGQRQEQEHGVHQIFIAAGQQVSKRLDNKNCAR
jgi:hypothetical protein